MENLSVIWAFWLDAQTVVMLLLELNSPCLTNRQLSLGWQRLIPSENGQKWMGKMGYQFNFCPYPMQDLPNWIQYLPDRISRIRVCRYFGLQNWRVFFLSFQMFPVGWELWELESSDGPKFLVFGTATRSKLPAEFSRFSSRSFTIKTTESGPKSRVHSVPLLETVYCIVLNVKERVVSWRKVWKKKRNINICCNKRASGSVTRLFHVK